MSLCTYTTFKAVHRCPLKLHAPLTHSFTANSRSASGKTTAGFLASNPSTCRTLLGLGCCEIKALLLLLLPMSANTSTRPDCMMGLAKGATSPKHNVDHARREALCERLQQRHHEQARRIWQA